MVATTGGNNVSAQLPGRSLKTPGASSPWRKRSSDVGNYERRDVDE